MAPSLSSIETALQSITASPHILTLLKDLHTQALEEEPYVSTSTSSTSTSTSTTSSTLSQIQSATLDRFVALDPDKCAFVYLLLRASGARHVVEAGTSFGVSTIYLALAVGQNVAAAAAASSSSSAGCDTGDDGGKRRRGKVIATENEPSKAARAREHWKKAGPDVEKWIDLREGDLRETLLLAGDLQKKEEEKEEDEGLDFLLLDIWTPLALPALKIVLPRLRIGATVVVDNILAAKDGYRDLTNFLADSRNGFKFMVLPFEGGLGVAVYTGVV